MKILEALRKYFAVNELEEEKSMNESCDKYYLTDKTGVCEYSGSKGMFCREYCKKYSDIYDNPEKVFSECNLRMIYINSINYPCQLACSKNNIYCKTSCSLHIDNFHRSIGANLFWR